MIVVDASVLVTALVDGGAQGALARNTLASLAPLQAPHLVDVEVTSAIRRLTLRGQLDPLEGRAALDDLARYPISRHDHAPLLARAWDLRDAISAYDAMYVGLAELLDTEVISADSHLARSSVGHRVRVLQP